VLPEAKALSQLTNNPTSIACCWPVFVEARVDSTRSWFASLYDERQTNNASGDWTDRLADARHLVELFKELEDSEAEPYEGRRRPHP
jgi:hypothetical protein